MNPSTYPLFLLKSFDKSQFPHKSLDLSFSVTCIKNKLTNLCGNYFFLQNDFNDTLSEISSNRRLRGVSDALHQTPFSCVLLSSLELSDTQSI